MSSVPALVADAVGRPEPRVEGRLKVTGTAPYAYEVPAADPVFLHLVTSTVAKGRITRIDTHATQAIDGVVAVVDHTNAPTLSADGDPELRALQSDRVAFRGQVVAVVLAETPEAAREGARVVEVTYAEEPHLADLRADGPELYKPDNMPTVRQGDLDGAMATAAVTVDEVYSTPLEHASPMEPHAVTARWTEAGSDGVVLTLDASTQSAHGTARAIATLFGLDPDQVRVRSPYVGGGFGSKGMPHVHDAVAAIAARVVPGRAVKLAMTRQQMFALAGYRAPTIQRFRLAADADGRLLGIGHDVIAQSSTVKEYGEAAAGVTGHLYAAPSRTSGYRLAALDVAVPTWMRAPGEMPGMFAHEVAMDELAAACGVDPIELRVRNEPETDPVSGKPFANRRLLECLRAGAQRFGWSGRDPRPGTRLDGDWFVGTGVAASSFPYLRFPGNRARVRADGEGRFTVQIGAADIGTGAVTVLRQIAADALERPTAAVAVEIGDSSLPSATVAGGSSGTASWGSAVVAAARRFREEHGDAPRPGVLSEAETNADEAAQRYVMYSFGAQFAEVRVNVWTGEVRAARLFGMFSSGRIINPRTARSQYVGGMTMGLGSALLEGGVIDPRFGHVVTQDLASYHVPSHADLPRIEAEWLDEVDELANPMGARGVGEIGIVGVAAAVANAAWHATGVRVRSLPLTTEQFVDLPGDLPALAGHPAAYA